jgi:copper(I)-binding protein
MIIKDLIVSKCNNQKMKIVMEMNLIYMKTKNNRNQSSNLILVKSENKKLNRLMQKINTNNFGIA